MPELKRQYDVHISLAIQQEGFHHAVFCDKIDLVGGFQIKTICGLGV